MQSWMPWAGKAGGAIVDMRSPVAPATSIGAGRASGDFIGATSSYRRLVAYRFNATLWMHQGEAAWHFVTLPDHIAHEIADLTAADRRGFGSVRVEATIGGTTWHTSIFPDTKTKSYVLPIKKAVRSSEDLTEGAALEITLLVLGAS